MNNKSKSTKSTFRRIKSKKIDTASSRRLESDTPKYTTVIKTTNLAKLTEN